MTVSSDELVAAGESLLADVGDGLWSLFVERGVPFGSPQEIHVTWRCPSVESAEALEAAAAAEARIAAAPPHAEAKGPGFGVAATVPFTASRTALDEALLRMIRLGAAHGAVVAGLGTMFGD